MVLILIYIPRLVNVVKELPFIAHTEFLGYQTYSILPVLWIKNPLWSSITISYGCSKERKAICNICSKLLSVENLFEFIWNLKSSFEIWKFYFNLEKYYPVWKLGLFKNRFKMVLTFHCPYKLFKWSQNVCKFSAFSLEFQKFSLITRTFFLSQ